MKTTELEVRLQQHAEHLKNSMAAPFCDGMEEYIMKKAAESKRSINFKKVIAGVAVAATFLLGSTAFASGVLTGWFSYSDKEYTTMPSEQECIQDVGYAPVLIQEFDNGYSYATGYAVNNERADEKTGLVDEFKSAMFEYEKDGDIVYFWQEKYDGLQNYGTLIDSFAGVEIYYTGYMNKIVPEDYEMTEADKEAEENGDLVFTWGSDSVQTREVKSLQWIKNGVGFNLLQTGGKLTVDELVCMAKEAIAD